MDDQPAMLGPSRLVILGLESPHTFTTLNDSTIQPLEKHG
jgi:hypothetical protein